MTADVVLSILASFPWIFVLGTVAFPGCRMSVTTCFHWSHVLGLDIVSFTMVASLQAAREEKQAEEFLKHTNRRLIMTL